MARVLLTLVCLALGAAILLFVSQPAWVISFHERLFDSKLRWAYARERDIAFQSRRLTALSADDPAPVLYLLGDSHMQGLCTACLPRAENLGVGREGSERLLERLSRLPLATRAQDVVIVQIGTADARTIPSGVTERMSSLLEQLAPARIILFSVVPGLSEDPSWLAGRAAVDDQLRSACTAAADCRWRPFAADDLESTDYLPDAVHLSASGYRKWLQIIRAELARLP